jgi:hypothetical protein
MHLYGSAGFLIRGPGTQGEADIDACRVQRINRIVEFDAESVIGVEGTSDADQNLRQIRIDAPVPLLVGIGQRRS